MTLSDFEVAHERGSGGEWGFNNPAIRFFDGKQPMLAFVAREALCDTFEVPFHQRTLQQWNSVVGSNLAAFVKIITAKYERDRSTYDADGRSYPCVVVTYEDMKRSGETFSDAVLMAA